MRNPSLVSGVSTPSQVADRFGISKYTVYRMVKDGRLLCQETSRGGRILIPEDAINAYTKNYGKRTKRRKARLTNLERQMKTIRKEAQKLRRAKKDHERIIARDTHAQEAIRALKQEILHLSRATLHQDTHAALANTTSITVNGHDPVPAVS